VPESRRADKQPPAVSGTCIEKEYRTGNAKKKLRLRQNRRDRSNLRYSHFLYLKKSRLATMMSRLTAMTSG